jgi:hypothetical protein
VALPCGACCSGSPRANGWWVALPSSTDCGAASSESFPSPPGLKQKLQSPPPARRGARGSLHRTALNPQDLNGRAPPVGLRRSTIRLSPLTRIRIIGASFMTSLATSKQGGTSHHGNRATGVVESSVTSHDASPCLWEVASGASRVESGPR